MRVSSAPSLALVSFDGESVMDHDVLLTETIARHFPDARITDGEIELGFANLRMKCWVHQILSVGNYKSASLFFNLSGGVLGPSPIFASVSGYDESPERAIVAGGCNWACSFGPVLQASLAGEEQPKVDRFEVTVDGQSFRVFIDGLDRSVLFGDEDIGKRWRLARKRFGADPWLARLVLESGLLPLLRSSQPTILSVFACDMSDERTIEVKVNGSDWPGMDAVFAGAPHEPEGGMVLLRELAVVVPISEPKALSRTPIEGTLVRLDLNHERRAVRWRGWRNHSAALQSPADPSSVVRLEERLGSLPADYRDFILNVAEKGAGPGYGLLSPFGDAQERLTAGDFSFVEGQKVIESPSGVLALASAGCGVMWLLVIRGPHRGEVWVDGTGSDQKAHRAAGSFSEWYRAWIDAAVADAPPFAQWDTWQCATPSLFSQILDKLEKDGVTGEAADARVGTMLKPGSISLTSGASPYFNPGSPLDPCQACVLLAARFGLSDDVFQPGIPSHQAASSTVAPRSGGLFSRLKRKFRGD